MREDELRELLADVDWLRALARRLSCDDNVADDLVQDTCEIALRKTAPPTEWRSWLVGVLRTLVMANRRQRAQHARSLTLVPKGETPEATASVVQRAEVHQLLMSAVMQLDEPYRSTVLLRYFENLPPRDIAERQQLPIATVHSRLQRAMQQLRSRLDRETGSRAKWLGLALPFAWPEAQPVPKVVSPWRVAGLVGGATIVVAAPFWFGDDSVSPPAANVVASVPASPVREAIAAAPTPVERFVPVDAPTAVPEVANSSAHDVRGRVLDCNGVGVGGLSISAVLGDVPTKTSEVRARFTTSAADGTFFGRLDATSATLLVAEAGYESVLVGGWRSDAAVEPVIVVAPSLAIGGRVVEADGRAVGEGAVTCELPSDLFARLRVRIDSSSTSSWRASIGSDGKFALAVPRIEGAVLRFTATSCAPAAVPLPDVAPTNMHVVLAPLRTDTAAVRGRVLGDDGVPAFGAFVTMGDAVTTADRDGTFAFDGALPRLPVTITAVGRGHLPARVEIGPNGGSLRDIVLQLGPRAGKVNGTVVDADGPVAGAEVWIDDPGLFGGRPLDRRTLQVEYLIGGGALRSASWDATALVARRDPTTAVTERTRGSWVHEMESTAAWLFVRTDVDGRFELPGLLPRAYRLRAFDPATGRFGEAIDVVASSRPSIVLPPRSTAVTLRGRVVSRGGTPLAGVLVQQQFELFARGGETALGNDGFKVLRPGAEAVTATDGTFVLRSVSLAGAFLMVDGEAVMPTRIDGIATMQVPADDPPPLLRVDRRCPVEVSLADPHEADTAVFVDSARRMLFVGVQTKNEKQQANSLPLHDGRSGAVAVGERAVSCVLLRNGAIVREVPIAPVPERTTLVQ